MHASLAITPDGSGATGHRAAAALPELLGKLEADAARVSMTLSNRFARFLVLPWSGGLATERDWLAFAEHRFASVFGADASAWSVRIASAPKGDPRLASAVEAALVTAAAEAMRSAGHRLVSLRPRFVEGFNRICRTIDKGSAWFVDGEPGRVTLGLVVDGRWRAVRQRQVGDQWVKELPQIVDREAELAGLPSRVETVYVACLDSADALPTQAGAYSFKPID